VIPGSDEARRAGKVDRVQRLQDNLAPISRACRAAKARFIHSHVLDDRWGVPSGGSIECVQCRQPSRSAMDMAAARWSRKRERSSGNATKPCWTCRDVALSQTQEHKPDVRVGLRRTSRSTSAGSGHELRGTATDISPRRSQQPRAAAAVRGTGLSPNRIERFAENLHFASLWANGLSVQAGVGAEGLQ